VNESRAAYDEMVQTYRQLEMHSPQYTRYDPYSSSSSAPPSAGPTQPYYPNTVAGSHMRTIQPRPVPLQPPVPTDPSVQQYTPTILEPPQKKKGRGRPPNPPKTQDQIEVERRAAAAEGREYPPPKPSRKRKEVATSPQSLSYPPTGSNTPYSATGPEQPGSAHGQYISPTDREYTIARGEPQRDPRDPNRWAETVGYSTASSSAVRQLSIAGPPSDNTHRGPLPPPSQYASSPRIAAAQQERTHSRSPSANYRQTGGQ